MNKLRNLARVTTVTTGTGTITLGAAVPSFLTFAQAGALSGDVVTYGIEDGLNSEVGQGTYTAAGTTLTRDVVYRSTGAANTGKITLSGTAEVYITISAEDMADAVTTSTLGAGVGTFLGTPSSANLQAAVTGETGSGALVFGTAPTISGAATITATPNITPVLLGSASLANTTARGLAVSGNYAYCSSNGTVQGFEIFDVTILTAPVKIGGCDLPGAAVGHVVVAGQYAYVSVNLSGNPVQIIDVSNPKSPTIVGALTTLALGGGLAVSGNYLYLAQGGASPVMRIYDITNPAITTSASLSSVSLTGASGLRDIVLQGKYAFVTTGQAVAGTGGFYVVDVSDPSAPSPIGIYNATGATSVNGLVVDGKYAYLACAPAANGLEVVDVSDPTTPVRVGSAFVTTQGSIGVGGSLVKAGNYLYYPGGTSLIQIIDITNPAAPVSVTTFSSVTGAQGIVVNGRYIYVTSNQQIRIYDLLSAQFSSLSAGSIDVGHLYVDRKAYFNDEIQSQRGLIVGQAGINSRGPVSSSTLNATTLTSGSVLFAGSAGLISQDNANFFWDGTNNFLGIGTATPTTNLDVEGTYNNTYLGNSMNNGMRLTIGNKDTTDNNLSRLNFATTDLGATVRNGAAITAIFLSHTAAAVTADLVVQTSAAGTHAERARFNASGITSAVAVTAGTNLNLAGTGLVSWTLRSTITSPADSQLLVTNDAGTDFGRLMFGGTTALFPALKRSATTLQVRTASDSAYASIDALSVLDSGVAPTGTTGYVRSTNPVLVTPNIGTPSAGVLTNCTGLPVGSVTGLGTNVATFLGTPTSANLIAAVTDETGSGALVFGTSPTFTGDPQAPTPLTSDNDTSIATTAFVKSAIAASGQIFYLDPTSTADVATYKRMLLTPSPDVESTVPVVCTGTSDFLVGSFITDSGVPGAVEYPAGSAYRRFYGSVSAGVARFHLQIYSRTTGGVETLVRDEFSNNFSNTTVTLQEWLTTPVSAGALAVTDRIVAKVYAQRVSGSASITVTFYAEGSAHASQIQSTLSLGTSAPISATPPLALTGGNLTIDLSAYAPLASPVFTGVVTMPTPFTLGATSVTSTGTQLNYLNAATGTTGTGALVFATGPTISGATISGTTTLTGMTAGSVLFAGTSSVLSQNNNNFFWDNTTNALGIGTGPTARLHLAGTYTSANLYFAQFSGTHQSSNTGNQAALYQSTTFAPTGGSVGNLHGFWSNTILSSTALTIGFLIAYRASLNLGAGFTGVITTGSDFFADDVTTTGGSVTNWYQFFAAVSTNGNGLGAGSVFNHQYRAAGITSGASGTGTVNNRGLFLTMPSGTAPVSGTVNNRGIYITGDGGAAPGGTGVVNNFALYSDSAAPFQIGGLFQFLGSTNAFPALRRTGTVLEHRLADDTAYGPMAASVGTFYGTTAAQAMQLTTNASYGRVASVSGSAGFILAPNDQGTNTAFRLTASTTTSTMTAVDSVGNVAYKTLTLDGTDIAFNTSGAAKMNLLAGGRLQIGATNTGNAATNLQVTQAADGTGVIIARGVATPIELWLGVAQTGLYADIQSTQGGVGFTSTQLLLNRQGGNVGIRTPTLLPQAMLQVGETAGDLRVYNLFTNATSGEWFEIDWLSNIATIGTNQGSGGGAARELHINTGGVEAMRITTLQEFAFGTAAAPSAKYRFAGTYTTANTTYTAFAGTFASSGGSPQYYHLLAPILSPSVTVGTFNTLYINPTLNATSQPLSNYYGIVSALETGATYTGTAAAAYAFAVIPPVIAGTNPFTAFYAYNHGNITNGTGITTGTIENYGFRGNGISSSAGAGGIINNYAATFLTPSGSGAGTTTNYGLRITGDGGTGGAGTTTNWSLYNISLARSYFAGPITVNNGIDHTAKTPVLVSSTALSGAQRSLAVLGRYAYTTSATVSPTQAFEIWDISNLAVPIRVGGLDVVTQPLGEIAVAGQIAYVPTATAASGVQIIDVSNPKAPSIIKTLNTTNIPNGLYISGSYLYVGTNVATTNNWKIYDISDPVNPILKSNVTITGATGVRGCAFQGKYAYVTSNQTVAGTGGFTIVDISDPGNASIVSTYNCVSSAGGVAVAGKYAFISENAAANGLEVVDISDPLTPVQAATPFNTTIAGLVTAALNPVIAAKYLYFPGNSASALQIIDISNPLVPVAVTSASTVSNFQGLHIDGRYAIMTANSQLRIYDLLGGYFSSLSAGSINTDHLYVDRRAYFADDIFAQRGLVVGQAGINSRGPIAANAAVRITGTTGSNEGAVLNVDAALGLATSAKFGSTLPVYALCNQPSIGFNAYYSSPNWLFGKGSVSGTNYAGAHQFTTSTGYHTFFTSSATGNADATATMGSVFAITPAALLLLGPAATASATFPALKRSTTRAQFRLADDSAFTGIDIGDLAIFGANGQSTNNLLLTEAPTTIAAAATSTTTMQIPARSLVLGVTVRVTVAIPTAATFTVGVTGAAARYGTGIAVALNTTFNSPPTDNIFYYAAATPILITPNLTPGTNVGRVRVTIHYMTFTPPTS